MFIRAHGCEVNMEGNTERTKQSGSRREMGDGKVVATANAAMKANRQEAVLSYVELAN